MEVGRRKKEEPVIARVSAIKNVLTVLAVAIFEIIQLDPLLEIFDSFDQIISAETPPLVAWLKWSPESKSQISNRLQVTAEQIWRS